MSPEITRSYSFKRLYNKKVFISKKISIKLYTFLSKDKK